MTKPFKILYSIIVCLFYSLVLFSQENKPILNWHSEKLIPDEIGFNGSFTGIHNNALIIAGGANFPNEPVWNGGSKKFYDTILVLTKNGNDTEWVSNINTKLPRPLAYGVSINTSKGVLCIGGENEDGVYDNVFLLKWNETEGKIEIEELPAMPIALSYMGGGLVGDLVYIIGGAETKGGPSTNNFLTFSLNPTLTKAHNVWEIHDSFPGKSRLLPVVVGQSNGHQDCLYVFSGTSYNPGTEVTHQMLDDVYQFDPFKNKWIQKNPIPNNGTPGVSGGFIAAAPAIKKGDSHILIFGGAGGSNQRLKEKLQIEKRIKEIQKVDSTSQKLAALKSLEKEIIKSTSFSKTIWAYHTITDTWSKRGELPGKSQVVTKALEWDNDIYIPGGEIQPGVRTTEIKKGITKPFEAHFGWVNYMTLITYLALMVVLGWYFSKRNKTTKDFFLASGRIPWWAAGLSIYATMLSAITYLSQPALAYSFDWQAYLGYFSIILIVPIIITFYLPFFRKLNITTAYEYLEKRFNVVIRMFGSTSFVLFQIVRMGIVVYLPALAIATVTGMDIYSAIISMGILAILYTYMGGIEAVIWTDVIQVVVLMSGLIIGLIYISMEIGDMGYIFKTAYNDGKMQMLDLRFSFTEVVTWSLFLGSFALTLVNYTTDQAVVQRYMTTNNEKEARKSIWLNGIVAIPAGLLIFGMGAFLYVYFKVHPEFLTVGMQNDSIFPLFINNHLPQGVSGLVIAGVFSASMSSLDSSMHSVSTVVTVDYFKRFSNSYTEKRGLKIAKWTTVIVGLFGTLIACLMATFPVKSLFFLFQEVIALFGSALAGIFILGIFIKMANWKGTIIGAILSILVLLIIKYNTPINFYIYPLIAIPICVLGGALFSFIIPVKDNNKTGLYWKRRT